MNRISCIRCSFFVYAILGLFFNSFLMAKEKGKQHKNRADYVIVGVGTAGGLMAKTLSDDKKTSVIALHSGQDLTEKPLIKYSRNAAVTVPLGLLSGPLPDLSSLDLPPNVVQFFNEINQLGQIAVSSLYQGQNSTPQTNADDRELLVLRAIPEGGASSINAGAWCRGTNQLFSQWEAITGSPEWSVDKILSTYKKLEHYHGKTNDPQARGFHGPLSIHQVEHPSMISNTFTQALINSTGFPFVLDYNDPNTPIGISTQLQLTQRGSEGKYRVSSATAFLNEDVIKPNGQGVHDRKLQVLFNSFALRTIWQGNTAIGVEYVQNGKNKKVYANKGVIVCAGIRSSAFLMHSGVGPSGVLGPLGIPVIFDNPNVGLGLADQPSNIMLFSSNPADTPTHPNTIFSNISWLPDPSPGADPISRQLRIATVGIIPGLTLAILDLCQPQSRGSITIVSADPLVPPSVDLGILSNPNDLSLFVSGFTTYIKDLNAAIQQIDPLYKLIFPDPEILDSPTLVSDFVKGNVSSNQHFQSHCRMALFSNGGVVDSTGRVYGVNNLFVADDSTVPQCMDGSPMATAYLMAARIAELLGYPLK